MKKILFLLVFGSVNIVSYTSLEKAIIDTDLQEVEAILRLNEKLTEEEKFICLHLSQQKIDQINNRIHLEDVVPLYHSPYGWLGIMGSGSCMILGFMCYENYSYRRNILTPIAGLIVLFAATYLCVRQSNIEESKYKNLMPQLSLDATKIKKRISNS